LYQVYGLVLFLVGVGFILLGAYLLYIGVNLAWQKMLIVAGICLFGYMLAVTGYRMSRLERF
jgi:hydrogenase/urease accessory protein HupE